MKNLIHFGAGPCQMCKEVLNQVSCDVLDYDNTGLSICEISHFSTHWENIYTTALERTRNFLEIPMSHSCFYMNGGATHQFIALCYNLCHPKSIVQVLVSGYWSEKAANEIGKYCTVEKVAHQDELIDSDKYAFTYYCMNETVVGYEFRDGLEFVHKAIF